jgi:hypothetical protein
VLAQVRQALCPRAQVEPGPLLQHDFHALRSERRSFISGSDLVL